MADSPEQRTTLSEDDMLIAEARAKANKPPRTPKTVVLAKMVEFYNSDAKTWKHIEQSYATLSAATLKNYVRENDALNGRVYPVQSEQFGLCLCKIS